MLRGRRSHQNFRAPSLTAAQPSSSSGNSGEHSSKSNRTGGPSADSPHPSPQVSVLSTTQRSEVTAPHRTEVTTASVARSNTEPPFTFAPPTPHPRPSQFNTQVTQQSTSVHAQGHVRSASGDTHPTPSREGSISHHSSSLPSRGRAIGHHSSISSARGRSISRQSSIPPIPTGIKRRHSDMDSSETPSLSHSDSGSKRSRIAALNKIGDAFQTYNIICQNAGIAAQATSLLQRTEDLPYEAILAIIDIFRTDSAAAEIYLTLEPEDLRRAWVRRELKKVNFVLPSESGPSGSGSGESRPSF